MLFMKLYKGIKKKRKEKKKDADLPTHILLAMKPQTIKFFFFWGLNNFPSGWRLGRDSLWTNGPGEHEPQVVKYCPQAVELGG